MSKRNSIIKKCSIFIIIGLVMAIGGLVLFAALGDDDVFSTIGVILLLLGIPVGAIPFAIMLRAQRCLCKGCGKRLDYENEVSWKVRSERTRDAGTSTRREAIVDIVSKCSNCGREKSFTKTFVVARVDNNGNLVQYDLDTLVRKMY